jgi:hypothetical protein
MVLHPISIKWLVAHPCGDVVNTHKIRIEIRNLAVQRDGAPFGLRDSHLSAFVAEPGHIHTAGQHLINLASFQLWIVSGRRNNQTVLSRSKSGGDPLAI